MVAQPGGGAPVIYPSSILDEHWGTGDGAQARHVGPDEGETSEAGVRETPGVDDAQTQSCSGLIVLLPLTLGLEKVPKPFTQYI